MRLSLRFMLVSTAFVALAVVSTVHCLGPVLPYASVAKVEIGMTHAEVRQILGMPNGDVSANAWRYERRLNPGWLIVYFDERGGVASVDHEPPFP